MVNNTHGEIVEAFTAADFRLEDMGGNLQGWRRDISPIHYVIVCFGDGEANGTPDADQWQWASYFHDRPEDGAYGLTMARAIEGATAFVEGAA